MEASNRVRVKPRPGRDHQNGVGVGERRVAHDHPREGRGPVHVGERLGRELGRRGRVHRALGHEDFGPDGVDEARSLLQRPPRLRLLVVGVALHVEPGLSVVLHEDLKHGFRVGAHVGLDLREHRDAAVVRHDEERGSDSLVRREGRDLSREGSVGNARVELNAHGRRRQHSVATHAVPNHAKLGRIDCLQRAESLEALLDRSRELLVGVHVKARAGRGLGALHVEDHHVRARVGSRHDFSLLHHPEVFGHPIRRDEDNAGKHAVAPHQKRADDVVA
mmetsp:Transcript_19711/g.47760  ORF Transcript_19711/g.47760 Transcript_19711/m.47760 type:complete len:277 (+) Transcript_19711:1133-1963(+)